MRLLVAHDSDHQLCDGAVNGSFAFSLFLGEVARRSDTMTLVGRLGAEDGRYPYRVGDVAFVALPGYASAASAVGVLRTMPVALRRFWRALDDADVVWLLGPNLLAVAFAVLACIRRRPLVLGVRQNLPELMRHRYDRRLTWLAADALEAAFRGLSRRSGAIVVGAELARIYAHAAATQEIYVSLVDEDDVISEPRLVSGPRDRLRMLSVGRLDPEKNALLLADVLRAARALDPRWELDVCGDGPLRDRLAARLRELGVADHARLHGEIPVDAGLSDFYRDADALIHVSHTEGVPQVILEAFAAGLPVVATAVGGVAGLVDGCGCLVAADDPGAAAAQLQRLVDDPGLRDDLVRRAVARVRAHTLQAEAARVAMFLRSRARRQTLRDDRLAPTGEAAPR